MKKETPRKLFRGVMATILVCGLMVPTSVPAAFGEESATASFSPLGDAPVPDEVGSLLGSLSDIMEPAAEAGAQDADADAPSEDAPEPTASADAVEPANAEEADEGAADGEGDDPTSDFAGDQVATYDGAWVTPAGCQFQISGGTEGVDYRFVSPTLHITGSAPLTVKNVASVATTSQNIEVDAGVKADLTLAGVTISTALAPINLVTNSDEDGNGVKVTNANQIANKTTLYLSLADGSVNSLTCNAASTRDGWPGIRCGWGSILVIDDSVPNVRAGGSKFNLDDIVTPEKGLIPYDGALLDGTAIRQGTSLAGMDSTGVIGQLKVRGGAHSAGIGSGPEEHAGTMVFNGGVIEARSRAFDNSSWDFANGAGIGSGSGGSGTVMIFNGGNINAYAGSCGSGIGSALGYTTNSGNGGYHMFGTVKKDAIVIPEGEANAGGYGFLAAPSSIDWFCWRPSPTVCETGVHRIQFPYDKNYFTMAGDITVNGGFVYAHGGEHGNAFGQSCAHGPSSNRNHIVRVTGGTLRTETADLNGDNPPRAALGASFGYTIITGGSVELKKKSNGKPAFQGIGDTAFNTSGIATWDDVEAYKAQHGVSGLPDTDKVFMITVDLSKSAEAFTNETIEKFKLYIGNEETSYGSPSQFVDGKLYLWLPEWVAQPGAEKEVRIEMSVRKDGGIIKVDPLFIAKPSTTDDTQTVKRYIEFDFPENYAQSLEKYYDGLPFAKLTVDAQHPIVIEREQGDTTITETLNQGEHVKFKYQMLKQDEEGNWVPDGLESEEGEATLPTDTGHFSVTMTSYQYANHEDYKASYWGHQAKGTATIKPVAAVLTLDAVEWGHLAEDGTWTPITEDGSSSSGMAGNRLKLNFDIRSARGTALTCASPTGSFQVKIDGTEIGEPVALTEDAMGPAGSGNVLERKSIEVTYPDGAKENRNATVVTYYLDPTNRDGLLDLFESAGSGAEHTVNVEYIADKNYIKGVDDNPDNAMDEEAFIVPVAPSGDVHPDGPVTEVPDPAPGPDDPDDPTQPEDPFGPDQPYYPVDPADPDDPDAPSKPDDTIKPDAQPDSMKVVRKTVSANYADFHKKDQEIADFFGIELASTSSASLVYRVSNPLVADFKRTETGAPVRGEDGKLHVQVNGCGTSVIEVVQKPNALYTGIRYILTVNVAPDPLIKPQVQIRLTQRNLTALAESVQARAASIMTLALPESVAVQPLADVRAAVDRSALPPRPGDVIEYTVTGLNLTPGSIWQAGELKDAIDEKLSLDSESVQIAPNYQTHSTQTHLGTPAFYAGFNWDGLKWADVDTDDYTFAAPTLTKGIPAVYGGQSTSVRFNATVAEGLGARPGEDGKLPVIEHEPGGTGGYGKDEGDLQPGEVPEDNKLEPDVDIVFVGDDPVSPDDPSQPDDPSRPDDPTQPAKPKPDTVIPKDPGVADIVTTVNVETIDTIEEHAEDRILVGDVLQVTVESKNVAPDTKLANAVVKTTLPKGMEPKPGSIRFVDEKGVSHPVSDSAYDPKTGIVAVNAGDIYGDESVKLVFDVEVVSTTLTRDPGEDGDDSEGGDGGRPDEPVIEGSTLGETPTDEWVRDNPLVPSDPDDPDSPLVPGTPENPVEKPKPGTPFEPSKPWDQLEEELISTPGATDTDMPPVLPSSPSTDGKLGAPDISLVKSAQNLTRAGDETYVGDTVRYTVRLSNGKAHSMWYNAVIRDVLPAGVDPLTDTFALIGTDGVERPVPAQAYDPATRVLAVTVGDLAGGKSATFVFDCTVTKAAVGSDIGNVASAHGSTPAGVDVDLVADDAPRPVPGQPYNPPEGWDKVLAENPGVSNADAPAYAPGTSSEGGAKRADAPAPLPGAPDEPGTSGDAPSGSGSAASGIVSAGDTLFALVAGIGVLAVCALVVVVVAVRKRKVGKHGR